MHIGNPAGVATTLADEQNRRGDYSEVIVFDKDPYNYRPMWKTPLDFKNNPFKSRLVKLNTILSMQINNKYDIIHFHYSTGFPFGLDLPLLKKTGAKIVMHFHGSDIRNKEVPKMIKKYADMILVSTPDLLEYAPNAKYVPNPINLEYYSQTKPNNSRVVIEHYPSNTAIKGTDIIEETINKLLRERDIEYNGLRNYEHSDIIQSMEKADIVIDQMLIGWYGMVAIEAMAMGKPVFCYLRNNMRAAYPPIVNVNQSNLLESLKRFVDSKTLRDKYGNFGVNYVTKNHDVKKVVSVVDMLYAETFK